MAQSSASFTAILLRNIIINMTSVSRHPVTIRPARIDEAEVLNNLLIDRAPDQFAGNSGFVGREIDTLRKEGEPMLRKIIAASVDDPTTFLTRVATAGQTVVGFCGAVVFPREQVTMWRGLVVSREHEGGGIGQKLEEARQKWALGIGQRVGVLVQAENERSLDLFKRQGFVHVHTLSPTNESPYHSNVLELSYSKLVHRFS